MCVLWDKAIEQLYWGIWEPTSFAMRKKRYKCKNNEVKYLEF